MNRVSSAQQMRPLNTNVPGYQRPSTSQAQPKEISKENFDKFLNQKLQKFPADSQHSQQQPQKQIPKSLSQSQLPNIQKNNLQQQNNQNSNNNQYITHQYYQQDQQQQNQQYKSQSATQRPPIQRGASGGPQGGAWPQSAKSHKQMQRGGFGHGGRPKSSQYTKPLIVHVEREFQENQLKQNPGLDAKNMSVYSREDMQKEQENILQDKLWDQVYYTKNKINEVTQSNNDQKAKIWNIEKENRKMQKQIEQWGLQKGVIFDQNNEVFVDSATIEKVYKDENFYAITMKQQLKDLGEELAKKDELIKDYEHKINTFKDEIETVNESLQDAQRNVIVNFERLKDEQTKLEKNEKTLEKLKNNSQNEDDQKDGEKEEEEEEEEEDTIEQLRFESNELAEQIAEFQENNKVLQFEISVQKQANKDCDTEKQQAIVKLEKKKKEIAQIKQELEDRGVSDDYNEYEIKKVRQTVEKQKTDDEIIEEKEKKIEDLKQKISDLNFDIQKMTQFKIIDKQDNQKEIESSQQEIYELEEKYLNILTEYYRIKSKNQQDNAIRSQNMTYFGSDIKMPTISEIEISEKSLHQV